MKKEESYNLNNSFSLWFISFLFLGLPLFVKNAFFNITQAKTLFFLALCFVLFVSFLFIFVFEIIRKRVKPFKFNCMDISVMLFGAFALFSAILSEYKDVWYGKNSRLQGSIVILIYVIVYFILSNNLKIIDFKSYIWKYLIAGFMICSGVAVLNGFNIDLFGFFQGIDNFNKGVFISTVGNINFFSAYICLCLPILFSFFIFSNIKNNEIIFIFLIALSAFSSILCSSDSFTLGFLIFITVFPFFLFEKKRELMRFILILAVFWIFASVFLHIYKLFSSGYYILAHTAEALFSVHITVFIVVLLYMVYFYISKFPQKILFVKKCYILFLIIIFLLFIGLAIYANIYSLGEFDYIFKFNDKWGSGRGLIYKNCFELIKSFSFKEILFGIGPESLQNEKIISDKLFIDQAHSEYLQTFISMGFFGLLSQVCVIISTVIIVLKRKNNHVVIALFLCLSAYWIQASVNIAQPLTSPFVYVYLAIISSQYKNSISN